MLHPIAPRDSLFHFVRSSIGLVLLVLLAMVSEPLAAKKSAPNPGTKSKVPAAAEITKPTKPPAGLDTALVRGYYLDGDFDPAIDVLETHLTFHRVKTHEDSVFAFKHLGVMHAAKYETREKGKYYMLKLLETEPTARILDMYASDMIYMIFKNIQDEYLASRRKFEHADATLAQRPSEDKPAEEKEEKPVARKKGGGSAIYWWGAGVAVAAGVATYVALSDEPEKTVVDHSVP